MVPHDSTEEVWRLDTFGEQRSESGEEGTEESDAKALQKLLMRSLEMSIWTKITKGALTEMRRATAQRPLLKVHAPLHPARKSVCSSHCYSLGCRTGNVSWADQRLFKDEGDPMSGSEEDVSHVTTENDGENPPASPRGKREPAGVIGVNVGRP